MSKRAVGKERKLARTIIYGELAFTLFPFVLLFIVYISQGKALEIISTPEWSLASTFLFGQTLVKFHQGLSRRKINTSPTTLVISMLGGLVAVCAVVYAVGEYKNGLPWPLIIIQMALFVCAIACFLVFGTIGQRLLDHGLSQQGSIAIVAHQVATKSSIGNEISEDMSGNVQIPEKEVVKKQ